MCTVLLRFRPGAPWPLLLAAVRDEFRGRPWDPPAAHWASSAVQGGRDRQAGGTWLAVDRAGGAVAALLNGFRRPPEGGHRPTRGTLALAALDGSVPGGPVPGIRTARALAAYDGFHLLRADRERVDVWSWDGARLERAALGPGDHIVVNLGVDRDDDPLVPHFRPLLAALADPAPDPGIPTAEAWAGWAEMLRGDGLAPTDPRALIIDHEIGGGRYGSTSASLVGLAADGRTRYDFTADPHDPAWYEIPA